MLTDGVENQRTIAEVAPQINGVTLPVGPGETTKYQCTCFTDYLRQ